MGKRKNFGFVDGRLPLSNLRGPQPSLLLSIMEWRVGGEAGDGERLCLCVKHRDYLPKMWCFNTHQRKGIFEHLQSSKNWRPGALQCFSVTLWGKKERIWLDKKERKTWSSGCSSPWIGYYSVIEITMFETTVFLKSLINYMVGIGSECNISILHRARAGMWQKCQAAAN